MDHIIWNSEWKTGFPIIDDQHKRLIFEVNGFLDAANTDFHSVHTANLIEFLIDFLDDHCEEEEYQMWAMKYPKLVEHTASHEHLRTTAKTLADTSGKDQEVFKAEVMAFVLDWIEHHVKGDDTLMAKHLIQFSQQGSEARL
jgi:hemerythrin